MSEQWNILRENLSFVLVCLLIAAGLVVIAKVLEKLVCKDLRKVSAAKQITYVALCGAIAGVLSVLEFPLPFAPSFYKLDFSELPVLIAAFYLGPAAGVTAELVKNLLNLILNGTTTAYVGEFANFVIGCTFVLPAAAIYHVKRTRRSACIGLIAGGLIMTVFGSWFNAVYLLPKFAVLYGVTVDQLVAMGSAVNSGITSVSTLVLFAVVPLNIIKSALVSVLTLLLYKRIEKVLFR